MRGIREIVDKISRRWENLRMLKAIAMLLLSSIPLFASVPTSESIGVIATAATVKSGSYQAAIRPLRPDAQLTIQACPLFVPVIENGYLDRRDPITVLLAREYLTPVRAAGVDTLILGCTHYPLIAGTIADEMGPEVTLVDSGAQGALVLRRLLEARDLLCARSKGGNLSFYVSDSGENFAEIGALFLGRDLSGGIHPYTLLE